MSEQSVLANQVPTPARPLPASSDTPEPTPGPSRARSVLLALRPFAFAAAAAAVLVLVQLGPEFAPWNPLVRYGLRVSVPLAVVTGLIAWLYCSRKGRTWDSDLIASLWAGIGGLTMIVALRGTPFGPLGIFGDQSYRTEYLTRLADNWQIKDYFYQNKPGYYAPTFFWVLGRAADIFSVEPWRMMKVAAIIGPFLAPLILYLFWRRHINPRLAALIAGIALLTNDFYEPYGWIVLVALIPWWIEVFYGAQREGVKQRHLITLGVIGGVMFSIYYYYFFLVPFFFLAHLVYERLQNKRWAWAEFKRPAIVLGIAGVVSSFFWLPLAVNFLTSPEFSSLNNRWLVADHGDLTLPMFDVSVVGALCLASLIYLVLTARTRVLSRGLVLIIAAAYAWHVAGFFLALADHPVMSFRMKVLVPLTLLSGAVIAIADLVKWAMERFDAKQVRLVSIVLISFLAVFAGDRYVSDILGNDWIRSAHNTPLPDGSLPRNHDTDVKPQDPSAAELKALLDKHYAGKPHPVLLSDRIDLYSYYPYYGFVQWNSAYSHPTAEFANRIKFLNDLHDVTPAEFAARTADNQWDKIDAFVMHVEGDQVAFYYGQDKFPSGSGTYTIYLPKRLFDPQYFEVTTVRDVMVAIRQ